MTPLDYPLVFAREPEEFSFLLQKTVELGYLENPGSGRYRLTIKGWERLAQIGLRTKRSAQAFVAMWLTPELQEAFEEGIKPALEATGYTPVRVDLVEHNEKICDRIIAEIRKSGLVVADFTGHRPNVYFEAGFAMGLGVPVIWTCHEDHIGAAHFDTRQYNHILWKHPQDLRQKLINRIEAVVPRENAPGYLVRGITSTYEKPQTRARAVDGDGESPGSSFTSAAPFSLAFATGHARAWVGGNLNGGRGKSVKDAPVHLQLAGVGHRR